MFWMYGIMASWHHHTKYQIFRNIWCIQITSRRWPWFKFWGPHGCSYVCAHGCSHGFYGCSHGFSLHWCSIWRWFRTWSTCTCTGLWPSSRDDTETLREVTVRDWGWRLWMWRWLLRKGWIWIDSQIVSQNHDPRYCFQWDNEMTNGKSCLIKAAGCGYAPHGTQSQATKWGSEEVTKCAGWSSVTHFLRPAGVGKPRDLCGQHRIE